MSKSYGKAFVNILTKLNNRKHHEICILRLMTFAARRESAEDAHGGEAGRLYVLRREGCWNIKSWDCLRRSVPPEKGLSLHGGRLNLCSSECRRLGVGTQLLTSLIAECDLRGFREMIAVIGDSNTASIKLREHCGFRHVGVLKNVGYKFDRWLDSVLMQNTALAGGGTMNC